MEAAQSGSPLSKGAQLAGAIEFDVNQKPDSSGDGYNLYQLLSVDKPRVIHIKPSPTKAEAPVRKQGENDDIAELEFIGRKLSNFAMEREGEIELAPQQSQVSLLFDFNQGYSSHMTSRTSERPFYLSSQSIKKAHCGRFENTSAKTMSTTRHSRFSHSPFFLSLSNFFSSTSMKIWPMRPAGALLIWLPVSIIIRHR